LASRRAGSRQLTDRRPLPTYRNEERVLRLPTGLPAGLEIELHERLRTDGERRRVEAEAGKRAVAGDSNGRPGTAVLDGELVVGRRGAEARHLAVDLIARIGGSGLEGFPEQDLFPGGLGEAVQRLLRGCRERKVHA